MYRLLTIFIVSLFTSLECASFQRYDTTGRYGSSTIANLNNDNVVYKSGNYGNDIANFPEVTRYPNYSPGYGYSTNKYPSYNTGYSTNSYNTLYGGSSSIMNYDTGYNTLRYGTGYSSGNGYTSKSGYGTGYDSDSYGTRYGPGTVNTGYNSYETGNIGACVNRSPQTGIWVDSLMGMWYGVEIVQHLGADSRALDYTRTCIVIHIAEPMERPSTENQLFHVQHINAKFRQEFRHLRLLWDEAGQTIEYPLYFRNDSAGFWHVYDGQNGTLTGLPNYQQFSGTVQVLKAVNDHLLLNFCQEAGLNGRPAQQYSVLFSRNPGQLDRWEIESVHTLLQTKRLSIASRRMVCGNNADRPIISIVFSILSCVLAFILRSS